MGLFDEVYNVAASPYTGVVYPRVQTKDLERVAMRYSFYEKVEGVGSGVIRTYTMDEVARFFVGMSTFFEVYYRVEDGVIIPRVEKVVMRPFKRLAFYSARRRNFLVYVDGRVEWALLDADYRDVIFVLSLLSMEYPVIVEGDSPGELVVRWRGKTIRFEEVGSIPVVCQVCGNVREFVLKEYFLPGIDFVCERHGGVRGNAVIIRGKRFTGVRFFDNFSPLFLVANLYGVDVGPDFKFGELKFSFVELPKFSEDYGLYVLLGGEEKGRLVQVEDYLRQ